MPSILGPGALWPGRVSTRVPFQRGGQGRLLWEGSRCVRWASLRAGLGVAAHLGQPLRQGLGIGVAQREGGTLTAPLQLAVPPSVWVTEVCSLRLASAPRLWDVLRKPPVLAGAYVLLCWASSWAWRAGARCSGIATRGASSSHHGVSGIRQGAANSRFASRAAGCASAAAMFAGAPKRKGLGS